MILKLHFHGVKFSFLPKFSDACTGKATIVIPANAGIQRCRAIFGRGLNRNAMLSFSAELVNFKTIDLSNASQISPYVCVD